VLQTHPEAMSALSDWTKEAIQATKRLEKGWDLWALLLADLCLLKDAQHRHKVGVKTPQDLLDFAKRKYLVLLTQEGTRWIKISDLALFAEVAKSKKVNLAFNMSNKTDLSIQIRGEHRRVDFTYHIGYTSTEVSGRHKLHAGAVARSEGLVEIRSAT
ncbi:MAG: hypothetical protein EBU08_18050, partial [Micrococcales bacterium]|nr:hypothetical protein [Micrococcales bacterium]